MKRFLYSALLVCLFLILSGNLFPVYSQKADEEKGDVTPNGAIGTVTKIAKEDKQLTLYINENKNVLVAFADSTVIIKLPAGETDLKKGTRITLDDIALKDRIFARGRASDDLTVVMARIIIPALPRCHYHLRVQQKLPELVNNTFFAKRFH